MPDFPLEAYEALRAGRACIIATDTVYGLAALPGSEGYDEIFRLKRRPQGQALPWLVAGVESLGACAQGVPNYALELAKRHWPGALTLVVRASPAAREHGGIAEDGTVALRSPDEPVCLRLIGQLGTPLACTSANLHGEPAVSRREELPGTFSQLPGYAGLPAICKGGQASTIIDCTGSEPLLLRQGPIAL